MGDSLFSEHVDWSAFFPAEVGKMSVTRQRHNKRVHRSAAIEFRMIPPILHAAAGDAGRYAFYRHQSEM